MLQNILKIGVGVIVGLIIGYFIFGGAFAGSTHFSGVTVQEDGLTLESGGDVVLGTGSDLTVGGTLSSTGLVTVNGGVLNSYPLATSTTDSETLKQSDILSYTSMLMTPTVNAVTLTMPASSTLSSLVPTAGDSAELLIVNATSTAAAKITIAGSTGVALKSASSTAEIYAGAAGVLKFIRKANTDIVLYFNSGI